ncbi:hypothetical protein AUC44_12495 [Deinococcus actinosclerus]|uniref:Uncharacterized protein n=2 Tax=Deinococcus actinosclerus TaxID=1768108 RepID=A0ABM5X7D1_9DEIO|nr:hypothetical protein AUC44_12495 [Deinococcus actinosclerus]
MTGGQAHPLPLLGPCDMCGAPDGVLAFVNEQFTEHHCPRCTHRHALYTAAYDHLGFLIRQAVTVWLPTWGHLPGVIDLEEQLRQIGAEVHKDYKAGCFDREGVRSSYPMSRAA